MPLIKPDLLLDDTVFGYPMGMTMVTASTDATANTIVSNSHGLSNSTPVYFADTSGGITAGGYYVVNAAANTFQISATDGGAAVDISANASRVYYKPTMITIQEVGTYLALSTPTSIEDLFTASNDLKFDKTYVEHFSAGGFLERNDSNKTTAPFTLSEFFNYGNFGQLRGETGIDGAYGYTFSRHYVFSSVGGYEYVIPDIAASMITDSGTYDVSDYFVSTRNSTYVPFFIGTFNITDTSDTLTLAGSHGLVLGDRIISNNTIGGFVTLTSYYVVNVPSASSIKLALAPGGTPITASATSTLGLARAPSIIINPINNNIFTHYVYTTGTTVADARVSRSMKWKFQKTSNPSEFYVAQEFINDDNYFRGQFNLGRFNNTYGISLPSTSDTFAAVRLVEATNTLHLFILPNTGVTDESTTGFDARCTVSRIDPQVSKTTGTNNISYTSHGLAANDRLKITSVGTSGLTVNTYYYVIVTNANTIQLSTTYGGGATTISSGATIIFDVYKTVNTIGSTLSTRGGTSSKPLRAPNASITTAKVTHTVSTGTVNQQSSPVKVENNIYVVDGSGNYWYVVNATDTTFQLSTTKGGSADSLTGLTSIDLEWLYMDDSTSIWIYRYNNYLPTKVSLTLTPNYWYEIYLETSKSALGNFPVAESSTNSKTVFYVYY